MTIKQFILNNHKYYRNDGKGGNSDVILSQLMDAIDTLESKPDPTCVFGELKAELLRRGFKNNDPT
jgi:hypothetical protein